MTDKILITGATGFLGHHLIQAAIDQGIEVVALGRNPKKLDKITKDFGCKAIQADLNDVAKLKKAAEDCTGIIHSAGLSTVWGQSEDFYQANILGTRHVVSAAQSAGNIPIVHISSPSIYIRPKHLVDVNEDLAWPKSFINDYAETKAMSEKEIQTYVRAKGRAVIIRPQGLIGAGDTTIFPRFIETNRRIGIPWIREGSALIDLTAVEDVAQSALCGYHKLKDQNQLDPLKGTHALSGKAYNITSGQPRSIREHLTDFFEILGEPLKKRPIPLSLAMGVAHTSEGLARLFPSWIKEPRVTRYAVTLLTYSRTLNIDAARRDLGFQPKHSLEQAMTAFVKQWRQDHARTA